ncbi:hypothetical protein ACX12E_08520 [Paenibacillus vandeheii]
MQNWFAWVHLQKSLITFRDSGQTMDAGDWWLDREIADLKSELGMQEDDSHDISVSSWFTAENQAVAADASFATGNSQLVR